MIFTRISSLFIGIAMIAQWLFFLITGLVPEMETAPVSIAFHIFIELATAALLILVFFFLKNPNSVTKNLSILAQGMLLYTVVNSAGYFAQNQSWGMLLFFVLILLLNLYNTRILLQFAE